MLADYHGSQGINPSISFTMAAGGSHEAECTMQLLDSNGDAVDGCFLVDVWLTKLDSGFITDDAPQANFTIDTDDTDGRLVYPTTATTSKHITVMTNEDGYAVLSLTDSGDVAYKIAAEDPRTGLVWVSDDWVDYGA
jgi:hypothetical protein